MQNSLSMLAVHIVVDGSALQTLQKRPINLSNNIISAIINFGISIMIVVIITISITAFSMPKALEPRS